MDSCPKELEPYEKAHELNIREQDYLAWLFNQYTLSAVSVAVEHCLAGNKAKSKYIEKPFMSEDFISMDEEKAIRKAIMIEEQYISSAKQSGLPETIIKK